MRVAFVSMYVTHLRSNGATRRTRRVAEHLATRGHDVTVLCAQWWDGDHATFEQGGVVYRRVTDTPAVGSFASKLPAAVRRVSPEVVQAANSPPAQAMAAKVGATLSGAPLVVDWWADDPRDPPAGYRRAARLADVVLAPSRMVATHAREHGATEEQVRVVPESVDMELVREAEVDRRADLVYARDLDADANVESFLLALAELRTRDWRATVIGDGPRRADAERMARDLRIADRVEFLGDLPVADRVPVFKGAHVFAQTATREPFATDLLWALACGCVGIVEYAANSSAHELVEGHTRGSRVTDPEELADEIAAATRFDRRTVDESYADFDHRVVLDRYLDCYRTAVEDRGLLSI